MNNEISHSSSACDLLYGKSKSGVSEIVGYVDSDFTGDLEKRSPYQGTCLCWTCA